MYLEVCICLYVESYTCVCVRGTHVCICERYICMYVKGSHVCMCKGHTCVYV